MVKLIFGVTDYRIHGTVQRVPCDRFALAYSIVNPWGSLPLGLASPRLLASGKRFLGSNSVSDHELHGGGGGSTVARGAGTVVEFQTDEQAASAFKDELRRALEPAAEIINRASRRGIVMSFQLGRDANGIMRIATIDAVKPL